MNDRPAALAGSFADYRLVKSRGVLQLIVEIPVESQAQAFEALGYPIPGTDIPVAVARLNSPAGSHSQRGEKGVLASPDTESGPQPQSSPKPAGGTSQRERYAAMSAGEQAVVRAAMLAQDQRFQVWATRQQSEAAFVQQLYMDEEEAADFIRDICCGGNSRRLIAEHPEALDKFLAMELSYRIAIGEVAEPR